MLSSLLATVDSSSRIVIDEKNNRLLIQGSQQTHETARRLLSVIDNSDDIQNAGQLSTAVSEPFLKAYPYSKSRLSHAANQLRRTYINDTRVAVAADIESSQLLIMAPAEVHQTIHQQLASLEDISSAAPAQRVSLALSADKTSIRLHHVHAGQLENTLRDIFGSRLVVHSNQKMNHSHSQLVNSDGENIEISSDLRTQNVTLKGSSQKRNQLERLIRILDSPPGTREKTMKVSVLKKSNLPKIQKAVNALQGVTGNQEFFEPVGLRMKQTSNSGVYSQDYPRSFQQHSRRVVRKVALTNHLQPEPEQQNPPQNERTQSNPTPTKIPSAERIRQLGTDVEIESLPDLDVLILRGRDRDVNEVLRIIDEIERLSAETEPVVEVYPLNHVSSTAVSVMIGQVNNDLISGRQGRVSVTPLNKPNALLLIGWGEAIDSVKELIQKLDQPVAPQSQSRVYSLRHAAATPTSTTLTNFFTQRAGGLGPTVVITPDVRTNSLIVQAAPRDLAEVKLLIEQLDTPNSNATSQVQFFKLRNSLAADLATILQSAIESAGGAAADQRSAVLELLSVTDQAKQAIKSGILNDVQITPDPRTNTLIVTAPPESMPLVAELIYQLDDSPTSVSQIKVFQIKNGNATSLVQVLRSLMPTQTGTTIGNRLASAEGESSLAPLRLSVVARTNSIVATGSKGELDIIQALLLRLDEKGDQDRKSKVYQLKNAPALDVATAINEFLRTERQIQQANPGNANPFEQIEREVIVVPEPVSNSIILSATPRFYEEITQLIEKLDEAPPQVMIQVLIADVDLGDTDEFGVELGIQDSLLFDRSLLGELVTTVSSTSQSIAGGGTLTTTNELIQAATNTPGFAFNNAPLGNSGSTQSLATSRNVAGQALSNFSVGRMNDELGFGGLVLSASSESVSILVRALQACRRLEILSRPQIMTLDNQPAFIQVGERVPRITGTAITDTGQINNIVLENVGLILGVTPRISPTGMVVMELDAEKSELGSADDGIPVSISSTGDTINSPRIQTTTAQTTVSAADGETVILAGLITKSQLEVHRKVPYLGDIPVLGDIFRYDLQTTRRRELLIILTPHIIRTPEDVFRIREEEFARMSWTASDVHELHGGRELCQDPECSQCQGETPVIYPDLIPRGLPPKEAIPKTLSPQDASVIPTLELSQNNIGNVRQSMYSQPIENVRAKNQPRPPMNYREPARLPSVRNPRPPSYPSTDPIQRQY